MNIEGGKGFEWLCGGLGLMLRFVDIVIENLYFSGNFHSDSAVGIKKKKKSFFLCMTALWLLACPLPWG